MGDKPETHTRYKLTDQAMQTWNGFQWEVGVERKAPGKGGLCTSGWLYVYTDPLLAVLLDQIHTSIHFPRLWKATVRGKSKMDCGLKEGWQFVRIDEEMVVPKVTQAQQMRFGLLCAQTCSHPSRWSLWAERWLSGEDRSPKSVMDARILCVASYGVDYPGTVYAYHAALTATDGLAGYAAMHATSAGRVDLIALAHQAIRDEPAGE